MLDPKGFVSEYGLIRISSLLSSFSTNLDDDPAALEAELALNKTYFTEGVTPIEKALFRVQNAITASFGMFESYACSQAKVPIDPSCTTDFIDCIIAKLTLFKISNCPGQKTDQVIADYEEAKEWLVMIGKKQVKLLLSAGCIGQTVVEGESPGTFGYFSPDLTCGFRYDPSCVKDDCGRTVVNFRTNIKEGRTQTVCCPGDENQVLPNSQLYEAGENIPAHKVVSLINNQLFITNPLDTLSAHSVIGITRVATVAFNTATVAIDGVVENSGWNFTTVTGMVFVSLAGDVTDIPPTTGYSIDFGSVAAPTVVFVDIDEIQLVA